MSNKQQYNHAQLAVADYNLTQIIRLVTDDGDWWGRVEPSETRLEMTIGQTDRASRERTYRLGGPIPINDPAGMFGLWWYIITHKLTDKQILDDLVDSGSRLKLAAELEAVQSILDPDCEAFDYLMVEDPTDHDWGVGIIHPETEDVWLVLWRNANILHTEPLVEFPPDMKQVIPVVQGLFINAHELTERDVAETTTQSKEDETKGLRNQ